MKTAQHRVANFILVVLGALALPAAAFGQSAAGAAATPSEAAHKLVAAMAQGDVAGATAYIASADRTRCTALLQASERYIAARTRFHETVRGKFEESPRASAFLARTKPQRIDHIQIVSERNAGADAADLDVKTFGAETKVPPNVATWHAVRENGQWSIQLPPCVSDQAMRSLMNQYQSYAAAAETVNSSVQQGRVANFPEAHSTLLKAEQDALRANGER
jgi:hypothetical protein